MSLKESMAYLKKVSILYVEDDKNIRDELVLFLQSRVRELFVATNGNDGYDLYVEKKPDIIISDVQMPKMNGIEMAKLIKKDDKFSNIIIVTAFNEAELMYESIEFGISAYLTKPLDLQRLVETVGKIAKNILLEDENKKSLELIKQYKEVEDISLNQDISDTQKLEDLNSKIAQIRQNKKEQ